MRWELTGVRGWLARPSAMRRAGSATRCSDVRRTRLLDSETLGVWERTLRRLLAHAVGVGVRKLAMTTTVAAATEVLGANPCRRLGVIVTIVPAVQLVPWAS